MRKKGVIQNQIKLLSMMLLLAVIGCTEVITLNSESTGGDLVIFGRLTNGTMGNLVSITRTLPDGQDPLPISGAVVRVIDVEGNLTEEYQETSPGEYELCRDIVQGQVGGVYRLVVELDGKIYTSGLQEMMRVLGRDELRYELDIEEGISNQGVATSEDVVRIFANTTFDNLPEEFYVRWTMEESYTVFGLVLPLSHFPRYTPLQCYIINELSAQDIFLVDGTEIRNVELNNREVAVRPIDRSFETKHYFNIIQMALNKESHEYWQKLQSITVRQGSIFDVPPAAVPGNFTSSDPEEDIFGFFEATAVDTSRLLMTNNDIPLHFLDPCQLTREQWRMLFTVPFECVPCLITEKIVEETCIFCNRFPNSTLFRPSYF